MKKYLAWSRWGILWLTCVSGLMAAPAVEWRQAPGYRWHAVQPEPSTAPGFRLLPAERTGVTFTNFLVDLHSITNRNLLGGSGVALGDVDGDGWCDMYFASLESGNFLYRNLGGLRFEDVTASAGGGIACAGQASTGAVLADLDGDGDLDLLVAGLGHGVRLFLNDGKARFTEVTKDSGLASRAGSMSMALADVDGDGDLDLYVSQFRPVTVMDQPGTQFRIQATDRGPVVAAVNGRPTTEPDLTNRFIVSGTGSVLELGEEDAFYRNDGRGHFARISFTDGTFLDEKGLPLRESFYDWGLAARFHDVNGDGAPDLYVCNDLFTPDRFWLNDGKGRFKAVSALALRNNSTFSMGVDFADINRDGFMDFITVDMYSRSHRHRMTQVVEGVPPPTPPGFIEHRSQMPRNTLQLNRGDGTFSEIAFYAGLQATEWSWGPVFLDVDLDGYEDLLVANGQLHDFQNGDMGMAIEAARRGSGVRFEEVLKVVNQFEGLFTPNAAYRNRGDCTFEDVAERWGFATPVISNGMALGDLDNDGDMDVVVNNLNAPAGIYENRGEAPRLAVRLRGLAGNRDGVGARIAVRGGPVKEQVQEILSGGRYLSGDDPVRVFAAGAVGQPLAVTVTWRSGRRSELASVPANSVVEVMEPNDAPPSSMAVAKPADPWFSPVHSLLSHQHRELPFDDFGRQPLLPRRLSGLGPGVGWMDVDGDGWDDAVVGGARGGTLAVFRNLAGKSFQASTEPFLSRPLGRDQSAVLALGRVVLAGASNWEDGQTNGGAARIYDMGRKASGEILLGVDAVTGPLAAADVDGDGVADLFVGGRAVAGRHPEPAASRLFRNEGGRFVLMQRFDSFGLISGAVFSDLNGDGNPDLVVVGEWGAPRVLFNEKGRLVERDVGLAALKGWWNSVATGDFDEDGRPDFVAGNWGLNQEHLTLPGHPRRVYYGDLRGGGDVDWVESVWDPESAKEVPARGLRQMAGVLPFLREVVTGFGSYGRASLEQLLGERLKGLAVHEASYFSSAVFLNRGDRFEAVPLPREAQLSPAFGIVVSDLDGDGHEDIAIAQNFFGVPGDGWRSDAGRGLVLRGDGRGRFSPVAESGIAAYGEGRGLAAGDFDHDGRPDLLLSQNGAETQLYRNLKARPGLRFRSIASDGGIGISVRVGSGGGWGPLREIQSGSGYGSQNSCVLTLSAPSAITALAVRLPNGVWKTNAVPSGAVEVRCNPSGGLEFNP